MHAPHGSGPWRRNRDHGAPVTYGGPHGPILRPATTPPSTSRCSRASTPSANGRACTSARPGRRACTTSSGRSSTTRSTRRWPGYCTRIDVTLLADGGVPRRRQRPRHPGRRAPAVQGQVGGRDRDDHAARGRQVRRRRLQGLGRSARRRRLGGERARRRGSCSRSTATASTYRQEYAAEKAGKARCSPGVPQGKLKVVAQSKRGHTGTTSRSGPTPTCSRRSSSASATIAERLQVMAFLNRGLDDRASPTSGPGTSSRSTFHVRRRHRRLRAPPQPVEGAAVQGRRLLRRHGTRRRGRGRVAVEHRLPRRAALVRERHLHDRGRDARRGLQARAHAGRSTATRRSATCEGEGRRPSRATTCARASPRSCRCGSPTRSSRARPRRKLGNTEMRSLVERATNEHLGRWLEEHPNPAKAIVGKASNAARARTRREVGARSHPAQDRARRRRHARQARRLRVARPRRAPSCSSSRATRPAVRRATRATRRTRRSCRCGARSSTSSGRRWTRSSPTPRSSRSPPRSAAASAPTSTSPRCATAR